jgi:hypothetical protein
MKFKIIARLRGSPDLFANRVFERSSLIAASRFHGEFWNINFAWSDRFYSTLYVLSGGTRRWQKAEVINWQ